MFQIILIIHVLIAISLVALVLVQQGKGASMGAGFGGGASGTVFGSQGSVGFLTKLTTALAISFFVTSLGLTYYASYLSKQAANKDALSSMSAPSTAAKESTGQTKTNQDNKPAVPSKTK
jgi:preprotein translocase subunit SecG